MRIAIVATLLLVATTVHASRPIAGRITYQKASPVDETHTKLRLVVTTRATEPTEVTVPIAIPDGFVVTGMALSMTDEDPITARFHVVTKARTSYEAVVAQLKDPALLEWVDAHHVRLRVYPVTRAVSATVTLDLTAADAGVVQHVTDHTSLIAVPAWGDAATDDDPYASYWPQHAARVPEV